MSFCRVKIATVAPLMFIQALSETTAFAAERPVRGGILNFVVGSRIPSYDGHRENTFGMIHPIRPFYSLLLRIDPENPQSTTNYACDLCETYSASADQLRYTFKIRRNVKFHDGTSLTAADIKASLEKIIFPPKGIRSPRKAWYAQIDGIDVSDEYTLVVKMKRPLSAIIPALASPFNFIYSKKDLDTHGYTWHMTHINGTGAFRFVQHQPDAFVEGGRNPNYHFKGKPYLDGFKAISVPKMSVRVQAIRSDRAAAEFRGFPPKARDDLVRALGKKVTVFESDWNVAMGTTPNQRKKRFQDVRVRQALGYALDRWNGSRSIRKSAIMRSVGGIFFPTHKLAASEKWLQDKLPGFDPDTKKNWKRTRELLKEAGYPNLKVTLWNRAVEQPYKIFGAWLVEEWRKADINADQQIVPTSTWYAGFRKTKNSDVTISAIPPAVINPTIDVSRWVCSAASNLSGCTDPKTEELYLEMLYEADPDKQYKKARAFEKYVLADTANWIPGFWWYRINVQRSYMKGWKIAPSHYLNQHLDQVWIDPDLR